MLDVFLHVVIHVFLQVGAGTVAGHVFRPSASELQEGVMVVEYSVVQDRYDMAMCQLNFVRTSIGSKT